MQVRTLNHHRSTRSGFTLVEILMVVAIIGILVGLVVPAVNIALRSAKKRAISMEVITLADAVEKYRSKYDDYPPDGSNGTVMQRHLRKAFPNIAATELSLFTLPPIGGTPVSNCSNGAPGGVMDPAEAIVFFLGGFSDDPAYPITGVGGPIFLANSSGVQVNSSAGAATIATVQYNTDRVNGFYEFKQAQLTLDVIGGYTVSTDEASLVGGTNDVMPAYRPSGKLAPYVYFNRNTYTSGAFFNVYAPTGMGYARPYRSDKENTKVAIAMANSHYPFMNNDTFQIISAGLDDSYGGIAMASGAAGPTYFRFPSGSSIDFSTAPPTLGTYTKYSDGPGVISMQLDNATNFAGGNLEDSLEN